RRRGDVLRRKYQPASRRISPIERRYFFRIRDRAWPGRRCEEVGRRLVPRSGWAHVRRRAVGDRGDRSPGGGRGTLPGGPDPRTPGGHRPSGPPSWPGPAGPETPPPASPAASSDPSTGPGATPSATPPDLVGSTDIRPPDVTGQMQDLLHSARQLVHG